MIDSDLPSTSGVYLICFNRSFSHARHYLGRAKDIRARIKQHRNGNGSRLLAAINQAGIGWEVVYVWGGANRNKEKELKCLKSSTRLCPRCGGISKKRHQERKRSRLKAVRLWKLTQDVRE